MASVPNMDEGVLQRSTVKFGLELHPSKIDTVVQGVREQLNAQLLRCAGARRAGGAFCQALLRVPCGNGMPPRQSKNTD